MLAGCCLIFNLEKSLKFLKRLVDKNNRIKLLLRVQFSRVRKRYMGLKVKTQTRALRIIKIYLQQQRRPQISQIQ